MNNNTENSWSSWKIFIIKTLEKLEMKQSELEKELQNEKMTSNEKLSLLKSEVKYNSGIISLIVTMITTLIINVAAGYIVYKFTDGHIKNKIEMVDVKNNLKKIDEHKK